MLVALAPHDCGAPDAFVRHGEDGDIGLLPRKEGQVHRSVNVDVCLQVLSVARQGWEGLDQLIEALYLVLRRYPAVGHLQRTGVTTG